MRASEALAITIILALYALFIYKLSKEPMNNCNAPSSLTQEFKEQIKKLLP
jgi:hypothetical protein